MPTILKSVLAPLLKAHVSRIRWQELETPRDKEIREWAAAHDHIIGYDYFDHHVRCREALLALADGYNPITGEYTQDEWEQDYEERRGIDVDHHDFENYDLYAYKW